MINILLKAKKNLNALKRKKNTYWLVCKKKTDSKALREQHQKIKQGNKNQWALIAVLKKQLLRQNKTNKTNKITTIVSTDYQMLTYCSRREKDTGNISW